MTQANHLLGTIEPDTELDLLVGGNDGDENFVDQEDEAGADDKAPKGKATRRRTQTKGLLVHSILCKYSPTALHNAWLTNQERDPNYNLRDAHLLYIPFARTDRVKRLPFFSLPKLWNDLPDFKLSRNPTTFMIALKEYLHKLSSAEP